MNIKHKLCGMGLTLGLLLAGPASADILTGQVYQVGDGDVYIKMADSTVARVPVETATFSVDGSDTPWNRLSVGDAVIANYAPVYGFQRYYYTDSDLETPKTVYIIQDADPNDTAILEYDGRLYHVIR